jgi:hypothetical protein
MKFLYSVGLHAQTIGVEYWFLNDEQCKLDASLFRTVGVNSVKIWEWDKSKALGSVCMTALEQAGIYVWASLRGVGFSPHSVSLISNLDNN